MTHTTKTAMTGRRGIIAIGAAMAAGIAVKGAAQPVAAATVTNSNFVANGTEDTGFITQGLFQTGVVGVGSNAGVSGSGNRYGLFGSSNGDGVVGSTVGGTPSTPLIGKTGVTGMASGTGNFGVLGISGVGNATVANNTIGVRGDDQSTGGGGVGVFGSAGGVGLIKNANNTIGVWGNNPSSGVGNIGVYGNATNGIGVYGTTSATGQFGVVGQTVVDNAFGIAGIANTNGSAAFAGATTNPSSFAASFQGHVQVDGPFDVVGAGNKHAVVPHPDGSHRTIYSVESPESWVEDFGEGTLTGGKAEVTLEKDFAALIHTDHFHVFLTTHGDYHTHVAERRANGFTVQVTSGAGKAASGAAGVAGTFSWRVVAKPKTEANVERLAKARLAPKMDVTKLPIPPKAPTAITPNQIPSPSSLGPNGTPIPSSPRT